MTINAAIGNQVDDFARAGDLKRARLWSSSLSTLDLLPALATCLFFTVSYKLLYDL